MKPVRGAPPEPYLSDPDFTLWQGDVREVLRELPAESVDCALTSPPFFGLRDYGTGQWEGGDPGCDHTPPPTRFSPTSTLKNDGRPNPGAKNYELQTPTPYAGTCRKCGARRIDRQIGLEATPDEWVAELVGVFREVRRILRPHGSLWIEVGDSYAAQGSGFQGENGVRADRRHTQETLARRPPGIKPKDLLGQPWMLAFALRADGWYLRQCLIWQKPNAMPESVRDRCTTGHSYVFLLAKQPRYWFDADAISEGRDPADIEHAERYGANRYADKRNGEPLLGPGGPGSLSSRLRMGIEASRNARSVWTVPTQGYAEAHFATWPEALVERILKAGCPEWVCGTCGKARERIYDREFIKTRGNADPNLAEDVTKMSRAANLTHPLGYGRYESTPIGWSDCGHGNYRPGIALDPFMGSGTTALVARRLGRASVGVELNPDYCAMAARRLSQLSLLAEGAA